MQWYRSFGKHRLFPSTIFSKIYYDSWYLLWHLPVFVCFTAQQICTFSVVWQFFESSRFESLRPHDTTLLWFATSCIVVSVLPRLHDIHNTILPSDYWFRSPLFRWLRGLANRSIGVREKTRFGSHVLYSGITSMGKPMISRPKLTLGFR